MGRPLSSVLLCSGNMAILLPIFWQGLLWGLTIQASKEAEVLCSGSTCYTLHWGRHSWMDAKTKCENNGGNLMTMKSQDEALVVQQLLGKMPQGGAGTKAEVRLWIGLHREKGKCYQGHQPLKGFSWVTGDKGTTYSNWVQEPRETCTGQRCVSLQGTFSQSQALAWSDGPCSSSSGGESGYLCKFSFQGMCRPLALAGPGTVTYTTPFGVAAASLVAVPFGSTAEVACGLQGEERPSHFLVCKAQPNGSAFEWSSPGPLCASPNFGCSYNNGGCEHTCLVLGGGSFQCACHLGYQLEGDHRSCTPVDYCSSSPCQGQCLQLPGGFECRCFPGYRLANDGLSCVDVNECDDSQSPCQQICVNSPGSFRCLCHPGYELAGSDFQACRDIDECNVDAPCAQLCMNTKGSFRCSCHPGYQLEGINSSSCLDVDECQEEPCEHLCINHIGSYRCACRAEWTLAPNGISCTPDLPGSTASMPNQHQPEGASGSPVSVTPTWQTDSPTQADRGSVPVSQDGLLQSGVHSRAQDVEDQLSDDNNNSTDYSSSSSSSSSKQFLYYILGAVLAFLLLMAFALIFIMYRKIKAKKAKKKSPKSASDNYSWETDQGGIKAGSTNEYM